jgi:hypothetical protein
VAADPSRRRAARIATLVAVPIAVAVALGSVWYFGRFATAPSSTPTPAVQPTSPVSVAAPSLSPAAAQVCRAVIAKLPDQVRGAPRRPVSAGAEQNAAYGEPPIVLACGVAAPSLAPTDQVSVLNHVCWYGRAIPTGTQWTTVDRQVPVSVTVPGPRDGSAQSVIPFSAVIAANDARLPTVPTGCT